jgi:hypothetical protein
MTPEEAQAKFRALAQHEKVGALIDIIWQSTLTMRGISVYFPDDCQTRWRLAYRLSEMNHRFASAASAMIDGANTYPDDDLMAILLDQSNYPELRGPCQEALVTVMERRVG